jgi:hypothetical protein
MENPNINDLAPSEYTRGRIDDLRNVTVHDLQRNRHTACAVRLKCISTKNITNGTRRVPTT